MFDASCQYTYLRCSPPQRLPRICLEQIDAELHGLFKLRSVLCDRQMDETVTLSMELRALAERIDAVDLERERDFYEAVREKARMLGQVVPAALKTGLFDE